MAIGWLLAALVLGLGGSGGSVAMAQEPTITAVSPDDGARVTMRRGEYVHQAEVELRVRTTGLLNDPALRTSYDPATTGDGRLKNNDSSAYFDLESEADGAKTWKVKVWHGSYKPPTLYWQAEVMECRDYECTSIWSPVRAIHFDAPPPPPPPVAPPPAIRSPAEGATVSADKPLLVEVADPEAHVMSVVVASRPPNADGSPAPGALTYKSGTGLGCCSVSVPVPFDTGEAWIRATRLTCFRPGLDCASQASSAWRRLAVTVPAPTLRLDRGQSVFRSALRFRLRCGYPPCQVTLTAKVAGRTVASGRRTMTKRVETVSLKPRGAAMRGLRARLRRGAARVRVSATALDRFGRTKRASLRMSVRAPAPPRPPERLSPQQQREEDQAEAAVRHAVAVRYEVGDDRPSATCESTGEGRYKCSWFLSSLTRYGETCNHHGEADSDATGRGFAVRLYDIGRSCH